MKVLGEKKKKDVFSISPILKNSKVILKTEFPLG